MRRMWGSMSASYHMLMALDPCGKGSTNNGDENDHEGVGPRALEVHHAIACERVVNENAQIAVI